MATDIGMCSNALLLVGEEPISSFSDAGHGVTVAAALYEPTYKALLSDHPWSFAMKEQQLSRLTATPDEETGYSYAYQLPSDMIRLWATFPGSNYVIVGDLLYSNLSEIIARYVYKVAEAKLPPHFVKAMEYKLASEFAVSITEDTAKAQFYEQKFMMAVSRAKSTDAQSYPNIAIRANPLISVRR